MWVTVVTRCTVQVYLTVGIQQRSHLLVCSVHDSAGGLILTGKSRIIGRETCASATFTITVSCVLALDRCRRRHRRRRRRPRSEANEWPPESWHGRTSYFEFKGSIERRLYWTRLYCRVCIKRQFIQIHSVAQILHVLGADLRQGVEQKCLDLIRMTWAASCRDHQALGGWDG